MQKYGVNELRKMYLEFFESKDHLRMNSFSLVPHNDNSLLIIPKAVLDEERYTMISNLIENLFKYKYQRLSN